MKNLFVSLFLILYIQCNAQITLTFSGESISDHSNLNVDSVHIQNKTNDSDTLVIGNYFSGTVTSIQNWDQNTNELITTYPNPFTNNIDILVQTVKNSRIIISAYSIEGRMIANWSGKSSVGVSKFNFKSGVEGIIYLNIKTEDVQIGTKILCLEKSSHSTIKQYETSFFDSNNQVNLKLANSKNKNFSFSYGDSVKIIGYCSSKPSIVINDVLLKDKQYRCYFDLEGYPTKLYKLDSAELSQLVTESPYPLDAYGMVCLPEDLLLGNYSSINDTNSVIDLAINTLIKNSKFTNVTSDSSLILKSVKRSPVNIFSYWDVIFENQFYNGLEILNTGIGMRVTDTVTFIYKHHFKYVFIPEEGLLPIDTIKAKIIGEKIEYYDFSSLQVKEITDNSIVNDFVKKIYWFEKDNYIEFRVVWQIPILYNENSSDDFIGWYIYVDILNGEILYILPTFIS